jgi:hypothetical protein
VVVAPAYQSIPLERVASPDAEGLPAGETIETGRIQITRYTAPSPQPVPNALSR